MTYLKGKRRWTNGDHRLFNPLRKVLLLNQCICISVDVILKTPAKYNAGVHAAAASKQFDLVVKLPLWGPIETAISGDVVQFLELDFIQGARSEMDAQFAGKKFYNLGNPQLDAVSLVFTSFYHGCEDWLLANGHGDKAGWPTPLGMGRIVRNALAHGGLINFQYARASPISWYGLSYAPDDNGRAIFETDLSVADLIILMVEMSDKLDELGCPPADFG